MDFLRYDKRMESVYDGRKHAPYVRGKCDDQTSPDAPWRSTIVVVHLGAHLDYRALEEAIYLFVGGPRGSMSGTYEAFLNKLPSHWGKPSRTTR